MGVLDSFHPAVASWFRRTYTAPTEPQIQAWPAISSGNNALIAAPTGSGKTLAAFLATIDALIRLGVRGDLRDEIHVVYVSPLKALSNDIQKNLDEPLVGIRKELSESGLPDVDIRTVVRTGDTPQADRERMRRKPALLNDMLAVTAQVTRATRARLVFGQQVKKGDAVLVEADITIACTDPHTHKPIPLPEGIFRVFEQWRDGAHADTARREPEKEKIR